MTVSGVSQVPGVSCKKITLFIILCQAMVLGVLYYNSVSLSDIKNMVVANATIPSGQIGGDKQHHRTRSKENDEPSVGNHSVNVDIHPLGQGNEHTFENEQELTQSPASARPNGVTVAVGLGITTRKMGKLSGPMLVAKLPFFHSLLGSFCKTSSKGFDYHFFLAYDYNDDNMAHKPFLVEFGQIFKDFTSKKCPQNSHYSLHFVMCSHTKHPAWAQNDAMIEAYISGMEYFYRINDDTIINTKGWTEIFIKTLNEFDPPRVGVVGPKHKGGNTAILTYDFTHRTHLEVHGFYYPRVFGDWYSDRWITDVYKPGRSIKIQEVLLVHTMEKGQRYTNTRHPKTEVLGQIHQDQSTVIRYITAREKGFAEPDPQKVIAMSVYGDDVNVMWGAIRNAQLMPVIFPGWTLWLYVCPLKNTTNNTKNHSCPKNIPDRIVKTLLSLGAVLHPVDTDTATFLPAKAWHYLVADDKDVNMFLLRDVNKRISVRDASAVEEWQSKYVDTKAVHCMKDYIKHSKFTIVNNQWGAMSQDLRKILQNQNMGTLLRDFMAKNQAQNNLNATQVFLDKIFVKQVTDSIICHDSITCKTSSIFSVPFPGGNMTEKRFVGQTFDAHEMPITNKDVHVTVVLAGRNAECESAK